MIMQPFDVRCLH